MRHFPSDHIGSGWYMIGITPTSPYTADMRSTTWIARKRGDGSEMTEKVRDLWVAQQNYQVDSDLEIWNRLSCIDHAPWAKSEASPMRMLRAWTRQFYGTSEPSGVMS